MKADEIQFDQYQRYGTASGIIERCREAAETFSILEVGANVHSNLGRFLPGDRIVYLDRELPPEVRGLPQYVEGDATQLAYPDGSFDFVVALDVYEHVPPEKRRSFLSELSRVARIGVVLAAPFSTEGVVAAEAEANALWQRLASAPHPWLSEHHEHGLPNLDETVSVIVDANLRVTVLPHGSLLLWTRLMKAHFLAEHGRIPLSTVARLDTAYNQFANAGDSSGPVYRHFLVIARQDRLTHAATATGGSKTPDVPLARFAAEILGVIVDLADAAVGSEKLHGAEQRERYITGLRRRILLVLRAIPSLLRLGGGVKGTITMARRAMRNKGWWGIKHLITTSTDVAILDYARWIQRYDTLYGRGREKILRRIEGLQRKPLISVVTPVCDPTAHLLDDAIWSVRKQLYAKWELCIADDASRDTKVHALLRRHASEDSRIKLVFRGDRGHISRASNSAIELASGEFVALLDHDDVIPEHALFCVAETINRHPDAGIIYSDEDKMDLSGIRHSPYFKCEWNPDLFLSHNMISHLGAYRAALVREVGGFREGFEGSQDYDLALRCTERLEPRQIVHIPRVLYHWQVLPGSASLSAGEKPYAMIAAERAINSHLVRMERKAKASVLGPGYRVQYEIPSPPPKVSLIILTRNKADLLARCMDTIQTRTGYRNYEIIVIDNGSDDRATLEYLENVANKQIAKVIRNDSPFNFAALNNSGAACAAGEILGFLNNDLEIISPEWLEEMVSHACRPDIGAVGARLWYPHGGLQHGGVVLGVTGVANHAHRLLRRGEIGHTGRGVLIQSFSAVTGACLVVRRALFESVNGFDERHFAIAYNDVDFCLRLNARGYRTLWTPYAELHHLESASRGPEDTPEKKARLQRESEEFMKRWGTLVAADPAYSPNLTLECEDFSLAWPPRVEPLN
jgi:GT2 family glycosyltransferase